MKSGCSTIEQFSIRRWFSNRQILEHCWGGLDSAGGFYFYKPWLWPCSFAPLSPLVGIDPRFWCWSWELDQDVLSFNKCLKDENLNAFALRSFFFHSLITLSPSCRACIILGVVFILSSLCIMGKAIHDLATKLLPEVVSLLSTNSKH